MGGRLYFTNTRLIFQPHRLDAATGGHLWSAPLTLIDHVTEEAPDGKLFSGGLRTRLRLDLSDGVSELFVVNGVDDAVRQIQVLVGSMS